MTYADIVMGTGGETSPLSVLPTGYWAMGDASGVAPQIGTGSGRDVAAAGIAYDTESLTLDPSGAANSSGSFFFDGSGENIQNFSSIKNQSPFEEYSVACWLKHELTSDDLLTATNIWAHYNNPNGFSLGMFPGAGLVFGAHRRASEGNGGSAIGSSVAVGQRIFVVGTFNRAANRIRMFENGALVDEGDVQITVPMTFSADQKLGNAQTTKIGSPSLSTSFGGRGFRGKMAHFMCWPGYEVTPAEVATLYAAGAGPVGADLTITGLIPGGVFSIFDDDDPDPQALGSLLLERDPIASSSVVFTHSKPGDVVHLQMLADGFEEFSRSITLSAVDQSFDIIPVREENL